MTLQPTLVKGMRDYYALQLYRRHYILSTIQSIYRLYGFEPLETPALENRATLTGKYGEEGEQLMFHVLKSGDFLAKTPPYANDYKQLKPCISDKGLRYDLTVPLMRHIATHHHEITFPFRRYQIQPVWRSDKPQKGRYREFLQCDADIVGSTALLCEAEILKLIYDTFKRLRVQKPCIKINHRGILAAIANVEGQNEKEKIFCTIVDKLEKIGWEAVEKALHQENFDNHSIDTLATLHRYERHQDNDQLLMHLKTIIGHTVKGSEAITTLTEVLTSATHLGLPPGICMIQPTLARGLSYYTGMVLEATVANSSLGSLGGGGRYDHLGDIFGITGLTGVGFSFGIDRLYDIMETQQCFDNITPYTTEILLTNLLEKQAAAIPLHLLNQLRTLGYKAEIYPTCTRIQKQLSYANKKKIPFVIILGPNEHANNHYLLKNMQTGNQVCYALPELLHLLKEALHKVQS